jgi:tetratricopeptide (TPR) repeat protein
MKFVHIILVLIVASIVYIYLNPSYKLSMEARFYFSLEDYEEAYHLSDEALRLAEYNNMAFHIKNRSQLALEVVNFNKEADEFEKKVIEIIKHQGDLTKGEKVRLKMMSDIVISKYEKLSLNLVDSETLKERAKIYYERFKKLNEQAKDSIE